MDAEGIIADAKEAEIPDWVYEFVTCAGCKCSVPKDEAEPVNHRPYCATCLPAAKHYAALIEKCDGARS